MSSKKIIVKPSLENAIWQLLEEGEESSYIASKMGVNVHLVDFLAQRKFYGNVLSGKQSDCRLFDELNELDDVVDEKYDCRSIVFRERKGLAAACAKMGMQIQQICVLTKLSPHQARDILSETNINFETAKHNDPKPNLATQLCLSIFINNYRRLRLAYKMPPADDSFNNSDEVKFNLVLSAWQQMDNVVRKNDFKGIFDVLYTKTRKTIAYAFNPNEFDVSTAFNYARAYERNLNAQRVSRHILPFLFTENVCMEEGCHSRYITFVNDAGEEIGPVGCPICALKAAVQNLKKSSKGTGQAAQAKSA